MRELRDRLLEAAARKTGKRVDEIENEIEFYNADYTAYGNEVYEMMSTRLAHWVNYKNRNWYAARIDVFLDRLRGMTETLLVDVGFSVSYLKACGSFKNRRDIRSVLVDKYSSAKEFHDMWRRLDPSDRDQLDQITIADIEEAKGRALVVDAVKRAVIEGGIRRIMIVASEIIEHLDDPQAFWTLAKEIEAETSIRPLIYATLPICGSIPSHTMAFHTEKAALSYFLPNLAEIESIPLRAPLAQSDSFLRGCVCVFGFPT